MVAVAAVACGDTAPTSSLTPSDAPARITNGTPTGTSYGSVGNLFADADNDGSWDWRCSGTLISPTVFLTAGHCYEEGATYYITFAPVALPVSEPLSANTSLISSTTAYLHPDYQFPYNDMAVVILPAGSTTGITPTPLAPEGFLVDLKRQGAWGQQTATAVGYGTASYGQGPYYTQDDGVRRYADLKLISFNDYYLQLRNNAVNAGKTGICYGDSGGPVLIDGYLVAVISWVLPAGCHGISGYSRVDTESSIDFLSQFVAID
jgi:V8-like Glu-specific endopeptidase